MKGLAVVLICVIAVVQGRTYQPVDDLKVPYVVHLRITKSQVLGALTTCVGTLFTQRYIVTAASCLLNARYVFVRYDTKHVYNPGFVLEAKKVVLHPEYNPATGEHDIGLINLMRDTPLGDNIQTIDIAASDAQVPKTGKGCGYGSKNGKEGQDLFCVDIALTEKENGILYGDAGNTKTTEYDLGAAVVADNKVVAILVGAANNETDGVFLSTSKYVSWIEDEVNETKPRTFH